MSKTIKKNILKVGITGGIGSGKTTVCRIFENFGIPIYYADDRAKWLMSHHESVISQVKQLLGERAYQKDGTLNRAYISSIVFNDQKVLSQLNAIVHPAVYADGYVWHESQANVPYTLKEAALLFEGKGYQFMDKMITVYAPKELRIKRVMKRDMTDRTGVEARIEKQMPDEQKMKLADYVVMNDGSKSLIRQVFDIHQLLIKVRDEV